MPRMRADNTSTVRKIFADNLSDVISESGKSIREIHEATAISAGALSKYQNDNAEAGIDNLAKLANYFNVSTDWLLGRTETRSPDTNKRAVCNYLCLSDAAVDALTLLNEGGKLDGARHFFLDKLLSAPEFEGFMRQAFNYAKYRCILHGRSDDDELDIIYGNDGDEPYRIPATLGNLLDAFKLRLVEALTPLLDEAFENWYREAAAASGEKWGADNG